MRIFSNSITEQDKLGIKSTMAELQRDEFTTFLHVSDIHFSRYNNMAFDFDTTIRKELLLDAGERIEKLKLHGILVSGDIAYSGKHEQYDEAFEWLNALAAHFGCATNNVWVVPGNHDVDRTVIAHSQMIRSFQEAILSSDAENVDAKLRNWLEDAAADGLFLPLAAFNKFAQRYGCVTTPRNTCWQADLILNDGSTLRLHGMNSVLASGSKPSEEKAKLAVGRHQTTALQRDSGIAYLAMCHHPLDWLLDGDALLDVLDNKVAIQLFGHKHRQRTRCIGNKSLILSAGALQPGRDEPGWRPGYNIIQLRVTNPGVERQLQIRVALRSWNESRQSFGVDDAADGQEYLEYDIALADWQPIEETHDGHRHVVDTEGIGTASFIGESSSVSSPAFHGLQEMSAEKRLIFLFLSLSYPRIMTISAELDLLESEDQSLSDTERFQRYFARAKDRQILHLLWDRSIERGPTNVREPNPFTPTGELNA